MMYFIRLMLSFLMLSMVVLAASAVIIYRNYESETILDYKNASEQMLKQAVSGTDLIWDWASMQAIELYNNGYVFSALYKSALDPVEQMYAETVLSYALNSNPYIYSIYLYNGSMDRIFSTVTKGYSSEEFYDREILDILRDESLLNEYRFIPRKISFVHYDKTYREDVISLIVTDPLTGKRPLTGALVLNIKATTIDSFLESFIPEESSYVVVYDKNDSVITHGGPDPFNDRISDVSYVRHIAAEKNASGTFTQSIDGRKFLITYVKSEKLNWHFVRVYPFNALQEQTTGMRNLVVIISLVVLLLAACLSIWLAWNFYKPYDKAVESLNTLKKEQQTNRGTLKQNLIRSLLQGEVSAYGDLTQRFQEFGINLTDGPSIVLVLQLDSSEMQLAASDEGDAAIVRFGIGNIAQEIIAEQHVNDTVDAGRNQIACIINLGSDQATDDSFLKDMKDSIAKIRQYTEAYFGIAPIGAIGQPAVGFMDLPAAYRSTLDVLDYRIIHEQAMLISIDQVADNMAHATIYTDEAENDIVNSLKQRNYNAVRSSTAEFFNRIRQLSYDDLLMSINRLAYVSIKTITAMAGKRFADLNYKSACARVEQMTALRDIESWFLELFAAFTGIAEEADTVRRRHVERVLNILNKEYGNPNLTSDDLASRLGLSANYLREVFKEITGTPLAGYINEIRCNKAADMLLRTSLPIAEIRTRVGLINQNYFFTLFKKYKGCTPRQYRDQARQIDG